MLKDVFRFFWGPFSSAKFTEVKGHWYVLDREIEKLKLSEMTCREGVIEVAKM